MKCKYALRPTSFRVEIFLLGVEVVIPVSYVAYMCLNCGYDPNLRCHLTFYEVTFSTAAEFGT